MNLFLVFICGVLYEVTSTYWLFASEKLKPAHAGFWSMAQAIVMLTGIGESIRDIRAAVIFVVGYSLGSVLGIAIEKRKRAKYLIVK